MSSTKNKILVIAPHQDDETFGCGGFIKQNTGAGNPVVVLFITGGWSGVNKKSPKSDRIRIRETEAGQAGKVLGVKKMIFLRKEDRSIYADQTLIADLVTAIQKLHPTIVCAPHKDDADLEHQLIHRLAKEAAWLAREGSMNNHLPPAKSLRQLLFYEVWSPIAKPNFYVDITDQMESKIEAMQKYKSQLKHKSYVHSVTGLNMFRGGIRNFKYAEAFQKKDL